MRRTALKLTLFTIFTVFVTVALASVIGNFSLFADTYSVRAAFTDATGVLVGDQVKIAGVTVGKVAGLEVHGGEGLLTLQIDADVRLPRNVEADIKYRNLLGSRVVNLTRPDEPSGERLSDGDVISSSDTTAALDLSVVFNNLRPLIQTTDPRDVNTVARAVLEVFAGREGDVADILGDLGAVAETLAARDGRLVRLVRDLDRLTRVVNGQSGSIRKGLGRFTTFTEALADVTPTIERMVVGLEEASHRFGRLIARNRSDLDRELADLEAILRIVDDNLGPLDRIARNLKEVLLATARSQSYGKWWNLYVINVCPEVRGGACPGLGALGSPGDGR